MFDQIIDSTIKWFVRRTIFSSIIFFITFSTILFQIRTSDDNLIRLFFQESCVFNLQIRYVFLVTTSSRTQLIDSRLVSSKKVLRACLERSFDWVLSYQRKFLWRLTRFRAWRSQSTSDIRSSCTYLLSKSNIHVSVIVTSSQTRFLTLYLIFIVTSDVKFTLAKSASKKKHNRSICDDVVFNTTSLISSDDDSLSLAQQISRTELARLTVIRSNSAKIARRDTRVIK